MAYASTIVPTLAADQRAALEQLLYYRLVLLHLAVLPHLQSTADINGRAQLDLVEKVSRVARPAHGADRVDLIYSQRLSARARQL